MSFNQIIVIVIFGFLGYIIVAAVLNWFDEKKGGRKETPAPQQAPGTPETPPQPAAPRRLEAPPMLDSHETPPPIPGAGGSAWYQVLGIAENAPWEQIVKAYQAKMHEYHPDKVAHLSDEFRELAAQRSKEVDAAYDEALRVHGR